MAYKTVEENQAYNKRIRARRTTRNETTATRIREILRYDPETGEFWRKTGNAQKGYVYIYIDGVAYSAHRLAWLYTTGEWPKEVIDHKNGNKLDNRLCNLREATHLQNFWNRMRRSDNTTGFKGVSYNAKINKFVAYVNVKSGDKTKRRHLGVFDNPNEAHEAYKKAAAELHGEFARFD